MLFKGSMRRKRPEYHRLQRLTFSIGPATILKISPGEITDAGMVELADAQDLGSCAARRVGSTPTTRIREKARWFVQNRRAFSLHHFAGSVGFCTVFFFEDTKI